MTVFFTMAYAPFVNASILGGPSVGMPAGPVFYATCLSAVIGSLFCGAYANTPTALAPGMAFNAFIAQYLQQFPMLSWQEALLVCFFVGAALLLMSLSGFRREVIEAIPRPIKVAVVGGIGALLAELGIKIAFPPGSTHSAGVMALFAFGLITIVLFNVTLRSYARKIQSENRPAVARTLDLVGRAGILISVIVVTLGFHMMGLTSGTMTASGCVWAWTCAGDSLTRLAGLSSHLLLIIPFAIFITYMLFADIAGSPYHLLPKSDPERDEKINRSFIVDSAMNMIAPVLGTSPVVFYAENNAGKMVGAQSGTTTYWVAAGFVLLALIGLLFSYLGQPLSELVPQVAAAPALFAVGLFVIASSLTSPEQMPEEGEEESDPSTEALLPAAVSIILTPIGLEYGLAGGILAYYVYFVLVPKEARPRHQRIDPRLHLFAFVAFFAILVRLGVS
jgi:adenine/guanine/hypoxanthine permease